MFMTPAGASRPSHRGVRAALRCVALFLLFQNALPAADTPPPPDLTRRFLFIVDTSFSMDRLRPQLQQTLGEFIDGGLEGWLQSGDTYGLWTFNEQVRTDFPMQVWDAAHRTALAQRVADHPKKLRFEKQGRLSRVTTDIQAVAVAVKDVTALILTDGEAQIKGTPFDAPINSAIKEIAPEMRKAKKPIVIALIAQGGQIEKWGVNSPEMMLPLPKPPPRIQPAPIVAAAPASPAPVRPALPAEPPPAAVSPAVVDSNSTAVVAPSADAAPALTAEAPVAETNAAPAAPRRKPASKRAKPPAPIVITRESIKAESSVQATNEAPVTESREATPPLPPPTNTATVTVVVSNAAPSSPPEAVAPSAPPPAVQMSAVQTSAVPTVTAQETVATNAPEPVTSRETLPAPADIDASSELDGDSASVAPAQRNLLVIGLACFATATLLGVLFLRHRRVAPQPSLITRGMGRGK